MLSNWKHTALLQPVTNCTAPNLSLHTSEETLSDKKSGGHTEMGKAQSIETGQVLLCVNRRWEDTEVKR